MTQAQILFAVTLLTFAIGILGRVWMSAIALSEMKNDLKMQTRELGYLAELHQTAFQGFVEKIDHSTNRFKGEIEDIKRRLEDLEGFLTKSTEFTRRR